MTKKLLITIMVVAITLTSNVFAEQIEVQLNNINVYVDGDLVTGEGQDFLLNNGQAVPGSMLYKDTTYLPIRKVAESLDCSVNYNSNINAAAITKPNSNIDIDFYKASFLVDYYLSRWYNGTVLISAYITSNNSLSYDTACFYREYFDDFKESTIYYLNAFKEDAPRGEYVVGAGTTGLKLIEAMDDFFKIAKSYASGGQKYNYQDLSNAYNEVTSLFSSYSKDIVYIGFGK